MRILSMIPFLVQSTFRFKYPVIHSCRTSRTRSFMSSRAASAVSIDLNDYITDIQTEIEQCDNQMFRSKLRWQNQKPIIRTLLGVETKDDFDKILRTQLKLVGYTKMKEFCELALAPRIHALPDYSRVLPNFDKGMKCALDMPQRGQSAFHRISSGKRFKGNMMDMISDLFPDLVPLYTNLSMPLTREDILLHTIEYIAEETNLPMDRVNAAKKCVALCKKSAVYSESIGDGNRIGGHVLSKANGLYCEEACIEWLEKRKNGQDAVNDDGDELVLRNVMVNSHQTRSRPKYNINGNALVAEKSSWNIIWTDSERKRACSEFDAVVLQVTDDSTSSTVRISEIWEAKFSLSPSSIHDLLTKKLPAIRTILDDEDVAMSIGVSNRTILCKVENTGTITFGIYGMDILPPINAIGQLKSTAMSYALSSDLDFAMNAVKNEFVEIDSNRIIQDLEYLRQKLNDSNTRFDIVAKISCKGN